MQSDDRYLIQLRRELTRSQARLAKAEQERDRLTKENLELRRRLKRKTPARPAAPSKRED
ncbi:MAG TPA: hypothetical protein VN821_05940 [Candidatus Udaeobacter sp.]|nr:hypothetical protein [Candidatus Udaeobacter sp.]